MSDSEPPREETRLNAVGLAPLFRSRPRIEWRTTSGRREVVIEGRTLVGSAPGVGIVIDDPTVSRLHAELDPRSDGLWVRDLGSRNGTFLEGLQITGGRIPQGGRLRIGSTEIVVEYGSERRPVEIWPSTSFGRLIGGSVAIRELFATLARLAPMDTSVLIHGETGTGKEVVARAIHEASARASKPFVVVDCAALPDNLLDAELFGHTKGAFTGAVGARIGAIEAAEGGTVFLDEIGELPISMQPKLLRVLESRTVRRIGESTHRSIDVRFISATHRDLLKMVNAGEFREDLYFRLAVVPVTVPPLRDRKDDIERFAAHFWQLSGGVGRVSPDLTRELVNRPWRGNVRELRNFIERARALGADQALALTPHGSPPSAVAQEAAPPSAVAPLSWPMLPVADKPAPSIDDGKMFEQAYKNFREAWIDAGEREYLHRLLVRHQRNVAAAAREAEVDRTYIYRLIRKHDL
jgi:transcriptional regulator with GAF, ATPase, and Fis domain